MTPELRAALDDATERLIALDLDDRFEPEAARAIVAADLHRAPVPVDAGGFGASMTDCVEVLLALGAIDGATALGFAMQTHVVGALRSSDAVSDDLRQRVYRSIVEDGALVNNAATEEGGGSPARGAIPGTVAMPAGDGRWRLTGEKTWTTWLPNLTWAFVSARLVDPARDAGAGADAMDDASDAPVSLGSFLVDLRGDGVDRRPGFEALGMRGSASGRLVLDGAIGALAIRRTIDAPDPRGSVPGDWFGAAIAATYLGVGEGARRDVVRWAIDRRPGDGSTAVADLPTVRLRLGRMDVVLRSARTVLLDAARRWDETRDGSGMGLAKVVCCRAAVDATDAAMQIAGGPGFLSGRLERALRDARAGLINPPLEDIAYIGFAGALIDQERAESSQAT